jgi:autotransporter-associated beta strand protein
MQIIKKLVYLMVGIAFVCLTSSSFAVAYWNCSSPTGPASGTWNETNNVWTTQAALFTYSPLGGMTDTNPLSWTSPDPNDFNTVLQGNYAAAFSLGTEPNGQPGPYTITVDNTLGTVQAGDLLVYSGPMTLAGGPLNFSYFANGSPSSSTEAGMVFTIHTGLVANFNLNMSDSGTLPYTTASTSRNVFCNKQDLGTLYLGAVNSFTGDVAVKSGTLGITIDQSIPSASSLDLLNGSDIGGAPDQIQDTPPVFNTGGHNQTLSQLVLAGPNSLIPRTIDFQNGQGTLWFSGNSSTLTWQSSPSPVFGDSHPGAITLVITNYQLGTTQLRFGTSSSGLTPAQLAQIAFANYTNAPGQIDANGYVTPIVPAPVTAIKATYTITWNAIAGTHYQVQDASVVSGPYSNVAVVVAASSVGVYTDVTPGAAQRYYRVIQE